MNNTFSTKKDNCEVCGKEAEYDGELHTHHISEQAEADQYGNIDHISKNSKGNLVVEGKGEISELISSLESQNLDGIGLITLVDNSSFVLNNCSAIRT